MSKIKELYKEEKYRKMIANAFKLSAKRELEITKEELEKELKRREQK